jgi:DNA mismatch repair protein MutL
MIQSPNIHVLPDDVASRIAAGEIVERPAAVVKELVDNSLDAGSTLITVHIEDGGKRLISVRDNGEGMSPEDARLACARFATSKLRSEQDLMDIRTFGFRGEALPSISSVSKFSLLTARRDDSGGTWIQINGGERVKEETRATTPGTQVEVAELFYNIPARLKFLKSGGTEFSHIGHVVQQAALVRCHTHFRLFHNNRLTFEYPAVGSLHDRLLQVYGQSFMEKVLSVHRMASSLKITGVTSSPYHTRTSRVPQEIFVNGRPVKNSTISHAIYEAYGTFLPKGRHPVFDIFLEVDPGVVDVNVHPTKREVKFSHPDVIHAEMKRAIREVLHPGKREESDEPPGTHVWKESWSQQTGSPSVSFSQKSVRANQEDESHSWVSQRLFSPNPQSGVSLSDSVQEQVESYRLSSDQEIRVLGQINKTFLVAQVDSQLHIIDQHTAHERVLFERLIRDWQAATIQQQPLLIPEPIEVPSHAAAILAEHLEDLHQLGIEVDAFGESSFMIRSLPALLGTLDYHALLSDLIEDLTQWKSVTALEQRIHPLFASMACQGAVQAGRVMGLPEIQEVIQEWIQEGSPSTCPHGRRIAMRFSSDELNKIFGRL